jgi:hypothetical protein
VTSGANIVSGDDHLRREGLVITVTGAVEVCEKHNRILIGGGGLQGLQCRPGAFEGRAPAKLNRVPANAFAGETPKKRALPNVAGASEAASGVNKAACEVVRPTAGERGGTGWEAVDVGGVEAEANAPGRRKGGRRNQESRGGYDGR